MQTFQTPEFEREVFTGTYLNILWPPSPPPLPRKLLTMYVFWNSNLRSGLCAGAKKKKKRERKKRFIFSLSLFFFHAPSKAWSQVPSVGGLDARNEVDCKIICTQLCTHDCVHMISQSTSFPVPSTHQGPRQMGPWTRGWHWERGCKINVGPGDAHTNNNLLPFANNWTRRWTFERRLGKRIVETNRLSTTIEKRLWFWNKTEIY